MRSARTVAQFLTVALLLIFCPQASALDPSFDASQYGHKSWKVRDGFVNGRIAAITQTTDGYLWLGTVTGLVRFDGVRAVPFKSFAKDRLPDDDIRSLLGTRDGSLWIGTRRNGLLSWKDGKLTRHPELDRKGVRSLAQDAKGSIWAAGVGVTTEDQRGRLCEFPPNARARCYGDDGTFDGGPDQILADRQGTVWISSGSQLWRWRPGPPRAFSLKDDNIVALAEDPGQPGALLISTEKGIRRFAGDKFEPYVLAGPSPGPTGHLLGDRDGGLWIATYTHGLFHAHGRRVDIFDHSDGLSGDWVYSLFEDREGNMWVGSADGLDRFHNISVANIAKRQGLSNADVSSVLAARDGSVWVATLGGVGRLKAGGLTLFKAESGPEGGSPEQAQSFSDSQVHTIVDPALPSSNISSLYEDSKGRLWAYTRAGLAYFQNGHFTRVTTEPSVWTNGLADDRAGLWISQRSNLLHLSGGRIERIPWAQLGRRDWASAMIPDRRAGGIWMGFNEGGLAYVVNGHVRKLFTTANGLGGGTVTSLNFGPGGVLWVATQGGLSRFKDGRLTTLSSRNGLPCDTVHWSIQDNRHSTWLYMPCGLVRITRADMDAWVADPRRTVRTAVFDQSDGVRTQPFVTEASPLVAKTPDGRIWFLPFDAVSVFDPARLKSNPVPPPVHVEQVIADRKTYDTSRPIRLPPRVRDLEIDYTALSFVAPEKVRFRYRLEGRDEDWREAGNRRQAFYTDLPPGTYRFHVIAANNSGVWNNEGATLQFSIAPAWWQTRWFYVLAVAALALLLWGARILRIRKLEREAAREQEVQERQRELQKELAHATRLSTMGQLTASISHEIRQPLAAVISHGGAAKRWLEQANLAKVRYSLDAIIQTTERADDIITGLRALAKKEEPRLEVFDLEEAVREVILLTAGEAEANNVAVRTEFAAGLPKVRGDRIQLQQVILNLVVNAIEAMTSRAQRQLFVSTGRDSSDVFVEVRDTGQGLEPAAGERLFQSFYTTKDGGMGMGLSVSRSIVEAHGGCLSAAPNEPNGAIFRFTLPVVGPSTADQAA